MNLDGILSTFSPEVRESPSMKGMVILIQTLPERKCSRGLFTITQAFSLLTSLKIPEGMTQPAIHDFLRSIGIDLSSGQVNHILLIKKGRAQTFECAGIERQKVTSILY